MDFVYLNEDINMNAFLFHLTINPIKKQSTFTVKVMTLDWWIFHLIDHYITLS